MATILTGDVEIIRVDELLDVNPAQIRNKKFLLDLNADGKSAKSTFDVVEGAFIHDNITQKKIAQSGETYGHINDVAQSIAGNKTFENDVIVNGKVGIGTNNPQALLHVVGTDGKMLLADQQGNSVPKSLRFGVAHHFNAEEPFITMFAQSTLSTNLLTIGGGTGLGNAATNINFRTAGNNTTTNGILRMTIESSGDIGINITPTEKLHVDGNVLATDFLLSSDERLKEKIGELPIPSVDELKPKSFEINGKLQYGFIAQDMLDKYPQLVVGTGREVRGEIDYYSIKQNSIIAILVKEIQKLKAKIN